jgi:TolB-like protein
MIAALLLIPTVAVMPFKDLSGGKGQVGEAIRETVTSDLKELGGLKVVERGNIDKVIAEQNLQAKKNDLGMAESIRVGTLLGASMIVAGSYQKASSQVRLIARFVDVATGEVKGSAKVDGSTNEFLSLQDKITTQLLKSAGLEPQKVQHFAARVRPKVKSFKAIELYGDAVVQTDEKKKVELLKLALSEDPQFSYASHDLDALEQRMKQYSSISDAAQRQATAELAQKLKTEKDPMMVPAYYMQLMGQLMMQHRLHKLIAVCRAIIATPPPNANWNVNLPEQAQYNLARAYEMLHDDDGFLREGEKFLAKYPASMMVGTIQMLMNNAITHKHEIEEGKRGAADEIARLGAAQGDPCKRAPIYNSHHQLADAKREYLACDAAGGPPHWGPGTMAVILARIALDTNDRELMHKAMTRLSQEDPAKYRQLQFWEKSLPAED